VIKERGNYIATFSDLINFLTREAEEQISLYGRCVFSSKVESKLSHVKGSSKLH